MIMDVAQRSLVDARAQIRSTRSRLDGVWTDPLAAHVRAEFWEPLSLEDDRLVSLLTDAERTLAGLVQRADALASDA